MTNSINGDNLKACPHGALGEWTDIHPYQNE
jgi:hypothetical protein